VGEGQRVKAAPARVVFADDDAAFRTLLRTLLGLLPHVTVVGEAVDGVEALRQVAKHYPDTVLLDVNIPLLDGLAAAEVIRSFRPTTRILLHSAVADEAKRRRAELAGLELLDKARFRETVDLVERFAVAENYSLAADIEPLVLLALAERAVERVFVVKWDETIPFHNPAFASALGMPFPPERITLADLRDRGIALRSDGSEYPLEEQPVVRALTERRPISEIIHLRLPDGSVRPYSMASVPFFDPDGDLIGVANYISDSAHRGEPLTDDDPLLAG
jgi:CheY-like chemotaxis protein